VFLLSPICATFPANLILHNLIFLIKLGEEYKSRSSALCNFLHYPVTSSLLGPNILLSTLFLNTLSLCSSLNVRAQVSHPYRTTGKIIVSYIPIFMFFDSRQEDRRSGLKGSKHYQNLISIALTKLLLYIWKYSQKLICTTQHTSNTTVK
jgi:hypothetical protein